VKERYYSHVVKAVVAVALFAAIAYASYWAGKAEHPETSDEVRLLTALIQAGAGTVVLAIGAYQVKELVAIVKELVGYESKTKYINKCRKSANYSFDFKGVTVYFAEGSEVAYNKPNG